MDETNPPLPHDFTHSVVARQTSHRALSPYDNMRAYVRQRDNEFPLDYLNSTGQHRQISQIDQLLVPSNNDNDNPIYHCTTPCVISHNDHFGKTAYAEPDSQFTFGHTSSSHIPGYLPATIAPVTTLTSQSSSNQSNTQKSHPARSAVFLPTVFSGKECPREFLHVFNLCIQFHELDDRSAVPSFGLLLRDQAAL